MSNDEEGKGSDFDAGFYEESFKRLESLGVDQVSSMLLNGQMPVQDRDAARVWLGRKARERAKNSKRNAMVSVIFLVVGIIVAIFGIVNAHLDAVRSLFH
jgi:hypothetical protein